MEDDAGYEAALKVPREEKMTLEEEFEKRGERWEESGRERGRVGGAGPLNLQPATDLRW